MARISDGDVPDAASAQEIGFVAASDPRFLGTIAAVEKRLRNGCHIFRYTTPDDFGAPTVAFTVCTFWYVNALAAVGRREEAREIFEHVLSCRNHLGLLSEDVDPKTGELWGNFPQTYNGRFDHLRHAAQQDLGGSILARLIPTRGVATL